MTPLLYGGDMVSKVTIEDTEYGEIPRRFEAGTQALAEGGRFCSCVLLSLIGHSYSGAKWRGVFDKTASKRSFIHSRDYLFGPSTIQNRKGIVSFSFAGLHAHDVGHVFARRGICARSGHHCAQPFSEHTTS